MIIEIGSSDIPFNIKANLSNFLNKEIIWPKIRIMNDWNEDRYSDEDDETMAYYNEEENSINILSGYLQKRNGKWLVEDYLLIHELVHSYQFFNKKWYWNEMTLIEGVADIIAAVLTKDRVNQSSWNNIIDYEEEVSKTWLIIDEVLGLSFYKKVEFIKDYLTKPNFWVKWFKSKNEFLEIDRGIIRNKKYNYNKIINFINEVKAINKLS